MAHPETHVFLRHFIIINTCFSVYRRFSFSSFFPPLTTVVHGEHYVHGQKFKLTPLAYLNSSPQVRVDSKSVFNESFSFLGLLTLITLEMRSAIVIKNKNLFQLFQIIPRIGFACLSKSLQMSAIQTWWRQTLQLRSRARRWRQNDGQWNVMKSIKELFSLKIIYFRGI